MGSLAAALAGAPWQMVLVVALAGLVVVLVQSLVHGTMPQESADRLTWWQAYWRRRDPTRPPAGTPE